MLAEGEDNSKLEGLLSTADTSSKVEVTIRYNNTAAKPPPRDTTSDKTFKQEPGRFRNSGRVRLSTRLYFCMRVIQISCRTMHGVCLAFFPKAKKDAKKKQKELYKYIFIHIHLHYITLTMLSL